MSNLTKALIWAVVILLIVVGVFGWELQKALRKNKQQENNIAALTDTVRETRNSLGQAVSTITQFQTTTTKSFLALQSADSTIKQLQADVKANKNRLGKSGSVTDFSTQTKVDTTVKTDTVVMPKDSTSKGKEWPIYISDFNLSNWITGTIKSSHDSTSLKELITNKYTVVLGDETAKKGLFHVFDKKTPFAEVTNLNPYSITPTLRSYQVSSMPPKTWGMGPFLGYGAYVNQSTVKTTWFIGIGLTKTLIRW